MKRNYNIDILKVVLAMFIALGHYDCKLISSGIIVNCFFIMSGYFLVRSFDSKKYSGSTDYSWIKIKRIYPYYIVAFILMICWSVIYTKFQQGDGLLVLADKIKIFLPEIFLIQNIGIFDGGVNYPLWQLSTLIIASHVLYSFLKFNRNLTMNAICPLIAIAGSSYFSNVFGSHKVEYWGLIGGCVSAPLFRAFANIAIGISLYDIINKISARLEKEKKIGILIILMFAIYYYYVNNNSYQAMCAFVLIFICCLVKNSTFRFEKILRVLDKLSLSIYVNHALIINLLRYFWKEELVGKKDIFIYIVVLLLYSTVFVKLIDFLGKKIEGCRKRS